MKLFDDDPDLYVEPMDTEEFRTAMDDLGLSQNQAAHKLGCARRTVTGYRTGAPIPLSTAILVRLLLRMQHANAA